MNYQLNIRMRKSEGTLVRLLGVVQRRCYDVLSMTAQLDAAERVFDIRLVFRPIPTSVSPTGRPADILERMVARLYDVESVELVENIPASPSAKPPTNGSKKSAPKSKVAGK